MMKRIILSFILFFNMLNAAQLIHSRYESIIKGQNIMFNLDLKDVFVPSINSVELFYKGDVDSAYSKQDMNGAAAGSYFLNLTPILNDAAQFQYYFSVKMSDGTVYSLPEIFPEENAFFADIKRSENDPRLRLLNPINKSYIEDAQPVFLISYEDAYDILDLSTVVILVDGRDVTKQAKIVDHFISYIPDVPLSEDNHTIEFHVLDKNKNDHSLQSSLIYRANVPSLFDVKGNETLQVDLYSSDVTPNTRPGNRMRNTLELSAKNKLFNLDLYDYRTSEEKDSLQRQNRTRLVLSDAANTVKLFLKDQSPVYSSYVLNGINIDGVGFQINSPTWFQLNFVDGETAHSILGDSSTNGTFTQKATAWQIAIKTGSWDNSFSYASFKDDKDSIALTSNWGTSLPQENRVVGWQSRLSLAEDQSSFIKSELAGSVYYPDISTGEMTTIPTEAKKIIPEIILKNIPIRAGMSGGAAGMIEWQTPVVLKELLLKTYGNFALPGFKSFGNSSIKTDDLAGGAQLKLNLLRGGMSFTGAYQKNRDKLMNILEPGSVGGAITYGDDYKANVNVDVFGLAYFGYNYNLNSKLNDATDNITLIDNKTQTDLYSLSNIRLQWDKFTGKLNTNLSMINYSDGVSSLNNFSQTI